MNVWTSRTTCDAGTESAHAGRAAVAARIPGEEVEVGKIELVDQVRHAGRMLMAAMEQHDGAARPDSAAPASAIEQAPRRHA
jgi:hypothetical protein